MLSENAKELFDLLASIPNENPRVYGHGARLSTEDFFVSVLAEETNDFRNTEALFEADITPAWHLPHIPQD